MQPVVERSDPVVERSDTTGFDAPIDAPRMGCQRATGWLSLKMFAIKLGLRIVHSKQMNTLGVQGCVEYRFSEVARLKFN